MKIGIDASRAFVQNRTGIELCAYQAIKHLRDKLDGFEVFLYTRDWNSKCVDFDLPNNWKIQKIPYVYGWTQVGLALEMLLRPVDIFLSPSHTTAFIHPRKTVAVIHGLEYEHCPQSYSSYARLFHRFFIKRSCRWATKTIAVSKNTKKDLQNLYNIDEKKIQVIYNGYDQQVSEDFGQRKETKKYLFYVGRLEQRKNIIGIVEAFEILKEKYGYQGELLLAGGKGHGFEEIQKRIQKSSQARSIKQLGFIPDREKWNYLKFADVFLFPSFCEGFGIPILEAQSMKTPVLTSKIGPLDEVAGDDNLLVNPNNSEEIAEKADKLINDEGFRQSAISKGEQNLKRFSWEKNAKMIAQVLKNI